MVPDIFSLFISAPRLEKQFRAQQFRSGMQYREIYSREKIMDEGIFGSCRTRKSRSTKIVHEYNLSNKVVSILLFELNKN